MPHISFSELKNWNTCPWYHKLVNIDKNKIFNGNEYTAFGTAVHGACEKKLLDQTIDEVKYFEDSFFDELKKLPKETVEKLDEKSIEQMRIAGGEISKRIIPALNAYFANGYEILKTEEDLMEKIQEVEDYNFKGFIDLVLKTPDGKIHIIDWKTCSWGWDMKKRTDTMTTYQLTLYKNFYAQKHGIDHELIKTHFALLKRTANKDQVEIFEVSSGAKKVGNALKLLNSAIFNILNENYVKNRLSCKTQYGTCEFYNTEHCKRN